MKIYSKEELLEILLKIRFYVLEKIPEYMKKIQYFIDLGKEWNFSYEESSVMHRNLMAYNSFSLQKCVACL